MCVYTQRSSKNILMKVPSVLLVLFAVGLALFSGFSSLTILHTIAQLTADIFMRLLQFVSLPIIGLSIMTTLAGIGDWHDVKRLGQYVVSYTFFTTIIAALIAFTLYLWIQPTHYLPSSIQPMASLASQGSYMDHFLKMIPSNLLQPFVEHNVMSVLFIALLLSAAILTLPKEKKQSLHQALEALYSVIMVITHWLIQLMPLAVWAFITLFILDCKKGLILGNLTKYLSVVIGSNLIQAFFILPLLLVFHKISPFKALQGMFPAISLAFFSKSSAASLPIAIECAEKNLHISPTIARFSFPLCTTINMNACAAFIFTTVLFVSESNGVSLSFYDKITWVIIATIAAIGNAGVPMGCFFLSSALLTTMDVPLTLMGVILPFYTLVDMLESAINIWSDGCVTMMVDQQNKKNSFLN